MVAMNDEVGGVFNKSGGVSTTRVVESAKLKNGAGYTLKVHG
jgi:hypothetical protein